MTDTSAPSLPYPALDRFTRLSQKQVEDRLQQVKSSIYATDDVWVFAYGSLMWNPAFKPVEQCVVNAPGFVRRYCFWTISSRGCQQTPGLGLGIEAGIAGCTGIAQRMSPAHLEEQLAHLWDREMGTGVYQATWIPLFTPSGRRIRGLGFVADPNNSLYVKEMDPDCMARVMSRAQGVYGKCRDYLALLVEQLKAMGVRETELEQLLVQVDRVDCVIAKTS